MGAVLPLVDLEVQVPTPGVFVLGRSQLTGPDKLAAAGTTGLQWQPILGPATAVQAVRGGDPDGATVAVDVGTLTATVRNAADPTTDPDVYRPGVGVRLVHRSTRRPLWTGTASDYAVTWDKDTDDTTVTLSAVDAVQPLANTTRYGAANPVQEFEGWERRVERVMQSSPVPYVSPVPGPEHTQGLAFAGRLPDEVFRAELAKWQSINGYAMDGAGRVVTVVPDVAARTCAGLVPGQWYRFAVDADLLSTATLWLDGVARKVFPLPDAYTDWTKRSRGTISLDFRATATSHVLAVTVAGALAPTNPPTGGIYLYGVAVDPLPAVQCANTVFESSLASHLTLITNTARTGWFVDAAGIVQIISPMQGTPPIVARLSDAPGTDPLHVAYTHAEVEYTTTTVINDAVLSNHARTQDEDGQWVADDRNLGPFVDLASAATWGSRRGVLETCVADVPGTVWEASSTRLGAAILADHAMPEVQVRAVTYRGEDYPDIEIDLFDHVEVTRRRVTHRARVVRLEHELTPYGWTVTLTLQEA